MLEKEFIKSFISKSTLLVVNFLLVIITSRFWGADGRGYISIMVTNMGVLAIIANVLTNSSVSYYYSQIGIEKMFMPAILWVFIVSCAGSAFVWFLGSFENAMFLFGFVALNAVLAFYMSVFVSQQRLRIYNIIIVLPALFSLILVLFCEYILNIHNYRVYYYCYLISLFFTCLISTTFLKFKIQFSNSVSITNVKLLMSYGWKNELSGFVQMLNYRLAYYFLLYYIGHKSVGLFSVAVAFSESVWVVSRSISLVIFSKILNDKDLARNKQLVTKAAVLSLLGSVVLMAGILIIPEKVYLMLLGVEYAGIKVIMLAMTPGILAIAFVNPIGHFFSARGIQNILIYKSLAGLILLCLLAFILIPNMGHIGAAISITASHIVSSGVLWFWYRKKANLLRVGKLALQINS